MDMHKKKIQKEKIFTRETTTTTKNPYKNRLFSITNI
jgi:hypothetical protein